MLLLPVLAVRRADPSFSKCQDGQDPLDWSGECWACLWVLGPGAIVLEWMRTGWGQKPISPSGPILWCTYVPLSGCLVYKGARWVQREL